MIVITEGTLNAPRCACQGTPRGRVAGGLTPLVHFPSQEDRAHAAAPVAPDRRGSLSLRLQRPRMGGCVTRWGRMGATRGRRLPEGAARVAYGPGTTVVGPFYAASTARKCRAATIARRCRGGRRRPGHGKRPTPARQEAGSPHFARDAGALVRRQLDQFEAMAILGDGQHHHSIHLRPRRRDRPDARSPGPTVGRVEIRGVAPSDPRGGRAGDVW